MNLPEENDPIETLLREQEIYIADGGFTARVLNELPRRRRSARLRRAILLGAFGLGATFAAFLLPWNSLPPLVVSVSLSQCWQTFSAWVPVFAVAAALTTTVIGAFLPED